MLLQQQLGVMLLEDRQRLVEQGGIRLGMHVAGQCTLHQPGDAVADVAHQQVLRHGRAAHVAQHAVRRFGQFRRGMQQRAVKVDDDGGDGQRELLEAHYFLTFASSARSSPMMVL